MDNQQTSQQQPETWERQPPANIHAEMAVIGTIMLRPETIDDISAMISGRDFYDETNQRWFEILTQVLYDAGSEPSDTVMARCRDALKPHGLWDPQRMAEMLQRAGSGSYGRYEADQVRRASHLRRLTLATEDAVAEAWRAVDSGESVTSVAAAIQEQLGGMADEVSDRTEPSLLDALHAFMDEQEALAAGEQRRGVQTGYVDVDNLTGGMFPGELIVIAGRPSHGKTAYGVNVIRRLSEAGRRCMLFSLEMSRSEIFARLFALNGVPLQGFRTGHNQDARVRMVEDCHAVANWPLEIRTDTYRASQIIAETRRISRTQGLDIVFVDYLQLVEPDDPRMPRQEQVQQMSRQFKRLANDLQIPVVVLAQVNRGAGQAERAPKLSELRESGAIEQDADCVQFVHRPSMYRNLEQDAVGGAEERIGGPNEGFSDMVNDPTGAVLVTAKQRNGPQGAVRLVWDGSLGRFSSRAAERLEQFDDYGEEQF